MRRTSTQRKLSLAGFKTAAKLGPDGCHRRASRAALARFHPDRHAVLKASEEEVERQACDEARARMRQLLDPQEVQPDVPIRATLEFAQRFNVAIVARVNGTLYLSDAAKKLPRRVCESLKNEIAQRYREIWNLLASS
jgi:hypothetical protein